MDISNAPEVVKPKKLCLVYWGGTIGQEMKPGEKVLSPPQDDANFKRICQPIIDKFKSFTDEAVEVDYQMVSSIDSSNMVPDDWNEMAKLIYRKQEEEGYDGVGIVMGTDTLAYAAGAVSLVLHENNSLKIPVDYSAAQMPVYEDDGDGRLNLITNLKTLLQGTRQKINDVMVNFGYDVFKGSRVLKQDAEDFSAFGSPNYPVVGRATARNPGNYGVSLYKHYLRSEDDDVECGEPDLESGFDATNVEVIELNPGYQAKSLQRIVDSLAEEESKGVIILKSLGDRNVPNREGIYNLIPVIKDARDKGVIVLITTKFPTGGTSSHASEDDKATYALGQEAINAGAISCGNMTDVMVWIKTLRGRAKGVQDWKKYMQTNVGDEI
jgi:L-asparaginase